MGTVLQVPWTRIGDWPDAGEELRAAGFHLAAMALTDRSVDLDVFARDVPERVALVMGTEGQGLTPAAIAAADTTVRIPMHHGVDSLNVAAASAVGLWAVAAAQRARHWTDSATPLEARPASPQPGGSPDGP